MDLDPVALVDDPKVLEDLLAQTGSGGAAGLRVDGRLGAGVKLGCGCLVQLQSTKRQESSFELTIHFEK